MESPLCTYCLRGEEWKWRARVYLLPARRAAKMQARRSSSFPFLLPCLWAPLRVSSVCSCSSLHAIAAAAASSGAPNSQVPADLIFCTSGEYDTGRVFVFAHRQTQDGVRTVHHLASIVQEKPPFGEQLLIGRLSVYPRSFGCTFGLFPFWMENLS